MQNISYNGDYPARIAEIYTRMTRVLHENGARIILGTDADNPYLVSGSSLLDELDYLVEVGFTPYEAIEAGTRNAAEALGRPDEFGTISEGKRADLILVADNPLQDVTHVRQRMGVMLRGQWLPETQLRDLLDELVASYIPTLTERLWPVGLIVFFAGLLLRPLSGAKRRNAS
jgi:adenine deaminase